MMRSIRSCYRGGLIYTRQVRIRWIFLPLALLAAGLLLLAGCGGISGSQSVSPASFFLPGLLKADPPKTNAPVLSDENSVQLATVR
jgi:hypothetical protein